MERQRSSYRAELRRIYELRDMLPEQLPPDAYFQGLDGGLAEEPMRLRWFRELESLLQHLDPSAWSALKDKAAKRLLLRDQKRGWQQLIDTLSEARAYVHLREAGYERVAFIRECSTKTPDLEAQSGTERALCEVKTINISEEEADRRNLGNVRRISERLDQGFFLKLDKDISAAEQQLIAFDPARACRWVCYIVVNFDDSLHEYADRYGRQIGQHIADKQPMILDVRLWWRPPFDNART